MKTVSNLTFKNKPTYFSPKKATHRPDEMISIQDDLKLPDLNKTTFFGNHQTSFDQEGISQNQIGLLALRTQYVPVKRGGQTGVNFHDKE